MLIKWLINTISILLAVKFVPGIVFSGEWWGILIVGLILGFVNTFIRPFVKMLTFPLLILSIGLFTFVINALMLYLTAYVSVYFGLGFSIYGFKAAFWGALLISAVSLVLGCLAPSQEE